MDDQPEDGLCYGVGSIGNTSQRFSAYNLGDLKREEDVLLNLYTKMSDQLQKLEVEELELKQKIRRKELNETTAELFPPPAPIETGDHPPNSLRRKPRSSKGKSPRRRIRRTTTSSMSHDDMTSASELDDGMSVASSALSINLSPTAKLTPTRRSPRKSTKDSSPSKYKAAKVLQIPDEFEPDKLTLELDLSALNSLSLPAVGLNQSNADFIESEDED